MAEIVTAPLTRDDISAHISKNQRVIRFFENLSVDVTETIPGYTSEALAAAAAAQASANAAQATADAAVVLANDAQITADLALAKEAFPIGAIFVTVDPTNPATTLGYGTWVSFAAGRVLVGVDPLDPDFNPVEKTGGSKTQTFAT